jgi:hypothetical protein
MTLGGSESLIRDNYTINNMENIYINMVEGRTSSMRALCDHLSLYTVDICKGYLLVYLRATAHTATHKYKQKPD